MRKTWIRAAAAIAILGATAAQAGWEEGMAAYKARNYAQAVAEFEGVVAARQDWSGGYLMLGQSLLMLDRNAQAVDVLRRAYDQWPSDADVQLTLAQAYVQADRHSDAAQLLGKVNQAALAKDKQAKFSRLYAEALGRSGQGQRALAELEKAAKASPGDGALQYQYGVAALNGNETGNAVVALERAVAALPRDAGKRKVLVQALIRQARETPGGGKDAIYGKAIGHANALVGLDPSYEDLMLLGEAQLGGNQYDGAVATFGQASAKNSSDWLPLFYAGQAHTAKGSLDQAIAVLQQALGKNPPPERRNMVLKQLGFVYEKQKNYAAAKDVYQRAGDSAAITRVTENETISKHNKQADDEAVKAAQLKAEADKLRQELAGKGKPTPPPQP